MAKRVPSPRYLTWDCGVVSVNIWCFCPVLVLHLLLLHTRLTHTAADSEGCRAAWHEPPGTQEPDLPRGKQAPPWVICGLRSALILQFGNMAHFMLFSYLSSHIRLFFFAVVDDKAARSSASQFLFSNHSWNLFRMYHSHQHESPVTGVSTSEMKVHVTYITDFTSLIFFFFFFASSTKSEVI